MKINRRHFLRKLISGGVVLGATPLVDASTPVRGRSTINSLPEFGEADICVIGGSCTGTFAAVSAARLGAQVILVEEQGGFGGCATNGLVNVWHTLKDCVFEKEIIRGLTREVIDRLDKRSAIKFLEKSMGAYAFLNTQELKIELDELVTEAKVKPYLHTLFSEPYWQDGKLTGIIVDGKSGRGIIRAKYFVDASGDGDLCYRMGVPTYSHKNIQPPTSCANMENLDEDEMSELVELIAAHHAEFNLPEGFIWDAPIAPTQAHMLAGTRIYGKSCCNMWDLTDAEIEGRRQIRAIMDINRKYGKTKLGLVGLASYIGTRESRHFKSLHQVTDDEALNGRSYPDTIANGSYHFDIHLANKPGVIFKELDGTQSYDRPGYPSTESRWRPETAVNPTYYQIPLRSLIPVNTENVIMAGRMFDSEEVAFSGMRVMVNMNQLGEAAGTTSFLALQRNCKVKEVPASEVRQTLKSKGSILY